jgi:Secretion system C-terminal sorting domain
MKLAAWASFSRPVFTLRNANLPILLLFFVQWDQIRCCADFWCLFIFTYCKMSKRYFTLILILLLLPLHSVFGQFLTKPSYFETTGVSNQGLVVGYEGWAGPYSIWNPDLSTTEVIGGLAPGNGVGGQARFSDSGNFLSGTSYGVLGPEMSLYNHFNQIWTPVGSLGFTVDSTASGGYCISGDGNTVVGNAWADTMGGHAYTHAVAWNATEGLIDLGSLHANVFASVRANAVNGDGSVVVGRLRIGPFDPEIPFIWTPWMGMLDLNAYLNDSLGIATAPLRIYSANCMSADGRYLAGYAVHDSTFQYHAYRVSLPLMVNVASPSEEAIVQIYPNPSTDHITVQHRGPGILQVHHLAGQVLMTQSISGDAVLDVSRFAAGIYGVTVTDAHGQKRAHGRFVKL